jgi:hypothetical protein
VSTGTSGRRDHPKEFMESLKVEEAISVIALNQGYIAPLPQYDILALGSYL